MCRITVITSLFNCQVYLNGYFAAVEQIKNQEEIEIVLIHNAPQEGELSIINKFLPRFPFVKHIVVEREGLYATWNRGIKMAKGKYITTWNVDDVRLPHSLSNQADALDANANAVLSYGDFKIVDRYGSTEGKSVSEPEFDSKNRTFYRQHHIGCFPMWRKVIHDEVGYFDEQFRLVADLDFQIRVAKKYDMVKVSQQLGYYLEGTSANLSSNFSIQDEEQTVLHMRYGNFNLIYLTHVINGLKNFKIFTFKWFGNYHRMSEWTVESKFSYISRFPMIIFSVVKWPRHLARKYLKKQLSKKESISATCSIFV
ncbi:MAG: glycosyltransferase [Chitinophagaceae bacterium]